MIEKWVNKNGTWACTVWGSAHRTFLTDVPILILRSWILLLLVLPLPALSPAFAAHNGHDQFVQQVIRSAAGQVQHVCQLAGMVTLYQNLRFYPIEPTALEPAPGFKRSILKSGDFL